MLNRFLPLSSRLPRVAPRIAGIRSLSILNARIDGRFLDLDEDSQIHFTVKPYLLNSSVLAQFVLSLDPSEIVLAPKLYLDYGSGYSEETAFVMEDVGEGSWSGYVPVPSMLKGVRLDMTEQVGRLRLHSLVVQRAPLTPFLEKAFGHGGKVLAGTASRRAAAMVGFLEGKRGSFALGNEPANHAMLAGAVAHGFTTHIPEVVEEDKAYLEAVARNETLDTADIAWMHGQAEKWRERPLFSVLMPVYDPPLDLLDEAIRSLRSQVYENWELCIADDASKNQGVRDLVEAWSAKDARIRHVFRPENGHISAATNSAASIARGDFLVLMDNDDLLPAHALWTVAHYVDRNPGCAMLYSDEDKISLGGFRCDPYNKGAFDRFLLYGHNMFSHLGVYRRSLFESVGGFRKGYEGSQDYDLTLRCMEVAGESAIVHIPHVLYHWRQIPGSTSLGAGEKSYAFEAAKRAINDHFERCGHPLMSIDSDVPGVAAVRTLSTAAPVEVSVIIPTRDGLEYLRACIDSLLANPDPLMEIVVVDNGSVEPATLAYLRELGRDPHRFKVVRCDEPFNFSRLCNLGVGASRGGIICLLNNDTELLVPGIFERARAWLSIRDVGIVGARLLYPDHTLQHFGVYTGVGDGGVAEHCYYGLHEGRHANFSKSKLLQQFTAVTGACLFIRRADYLAFRGCDESLAVAYNDIDLCLKVRRHGLKIICDPAIKLIHKESKSRGSDASPAKRARLETEVNRMLGKWGSDGLVDPFYSPNFSTAHATFELAHKPSGGIPWKSPWGLTAVTELLQVG